MTPQAKEKDQHQHEYMYKHSQSNHLPSIIKKYIKQLSKITSNAKIFNEAVKVYTEVLGKNRPQGDTKLCGGKTHVKQRVPRQKATAKQIQQKVLAKKASDAAIKRSRKRLMTWIQSTPNTEIQHECHTQYSQKIPHPAEHAFRRVSAITPKLSTKTHWEIKFYNNQPTEQKSRMQTTLKK